MDIMILKRVKEYQIMEEKLNNVFEYIKDFVNKNNYPPTVKQIAEELKYNEVTEVKPAIDELVKKGKLKIEPSKGRRIKIIE